MGYFEQALIICREVKDRKSEAYTLEGLGWAYKGLGRNDKVVESFEQALVVSRESGDREAEANILLSSGWANINIGRKDRVLESFEQALVISREIKDRELEANAANGLALTYSSLGNLYKAQEIWRGHIERSSEGRAFINLGSAYEKLGWKGRAREYYEKALVERLKSFST